MANTEIEALALVAKALEGQPPDAIERIIRWASSRHSIVEIPAARDKIQPDSGNKTAIGSSDFASFPDLYDAANPKTELQRVLVVGYWLQEHEGSAEWAAQPANDLLKNLGHPVSNMTRSLTDLQNSKPRFAMQTQKSGKSQQARKLYKLTVEGVREVMKLLRGEG